MNHRDHVLIAEIAHAVNSIYRKANGEAPSEKWKEFLFSPQCEGVISGVANILATPGITPQQSHEAWMRSKLDAGWKYAEMQSDYAKEHPCLVPFDVLTKEQQNKDVLFIGIVQLLSEVMA